MPRKQRFKPSRKPKPSPQTEEAMIGHPATSVSPGATPEDRDDVRQQPSDESPTQLESERGAR